MAREEGAVAQWPGRKGLVLSGLGGRISGLLAGKKGRFASEVLAGFRNIQVYKKGLEAFPDPFSNGCYNHQNTIVSESTF